MSKIKQTKKKNKGRKGSLKIIDFKKVEVSVDAYNWILTFKNQSHGPYYFSVFENLCEELFDHLLKKEYEKLEDIPKQIKEAKKYIKKLTSRIEVNLEKLNIEKEMG